MLIRKLLVAVAALLAMTFHSSSQAGSQYYYYGYLAGQSASGSAGAAYFLMDVQNGANRQIYFDMKDNATGAYYKTSNPAGNMITTAEYSPDHLYYAGSMYSGKKLVLFELTVCRDAGSECGFAVKFKLKDKKTGKILAYRYDLLDANSRVYGCP